MTIYSIVRALVAYILLVPQILNPFFSTLFNKSTFYDSWSADTQYTSDYAVELKKDPDKDFIILNLADVQLHDFEYFGENGKHAEEMIKNLVSDLNPDLITLSGDNSWGTVTQIKLVELMESFGIPWAPVMGNHDGERCISEFWCAYLYYNAENCLFSFGPENMGFGNYIINITENDKIIHTLYMMDTHSDAEYTLPDGTQDDGYDHLHSDQIEWYRWAVNGTNETAKTNVESTVIFHIPPYEIDEIYHNSYDVTNDCFIGEYFDSAYGFMHENPGTAPVNNGFLSIVNELGSTKNIIFGHDHVNNASVLVDGIRLTYGLKLGYGCYYEEGMMGGTTISINSNGNANVQHHYYG